MHAIIEPLGTDLLCRLAGAPAEQRIPQSEALPRLRDWAERYEMAVVADNDVELLRIGRELYDWLDGLGWVAGWVRSDDAHRLDIRADDPTEAFAVALLAAPWEFLADPQGFLAADRARPFVIHRQRSAAAAAATAPDATQETHRALSRRDAAEMAMADGRLDEALTILVDEVLPHFEQSGDTREKAITQGRIADVLVAQGRLDEAMKLQAERLPAVTALGDQEGIAHLLFSMANIRLARGEHERGGLQKIYEELAEAFRISCQSGEPDAIGGIGLLLVQVLAMGGLRDEAFETLDITEDAFTNLRDLDGLAQVRALRDALGG